MTSQKSKSAQREPILDTLSAEAKANKGKATSKATPKNKITNKVADKSKDTVADGIRHAPGTSGLAKFLPQAEGRSPSGLGKIPHKSATDKRIDRLEFMIQSQNKLLMQTLCPEEENEYEGNFGYNQHHYAQDGYYEAQDGYYEGDEDGEGLHHMDEEEELDEALIDPEDTEQEDDLPTNAGAMPPRQTEVLAAAVSNEIKPAESTNPSEPSGFAAKFAPVPTGPAIDDELAKCLSYMLKNKLAEKPVQDVIDKYDTPTNCKEMMTPKVNAPIWEGLKPNARSNDLKLQKIQKTLLAGLIAFTKGAKMHGLSQEGQDALTCLTVANFELNMMRRDLIKPGLNARLAQLCKPTVAITSNLFGDELSKSIKDLHEVHKATDQVNRRFSPYNRRGSYRSNRGRFLGRGGHRQGYQIQQPYRGRPLTAKRGRGRGAPRSQ